uniref:Reverse transcriptase domain-containing protein n=1 Tax=Trichogramma kaykai TaxID=54128 RepID=A0ABD2WB96_9HYME
MQGKTLPGTSKVQHRIITTDDDPINVKQYKYPHALKEEVNKQVQEMLDSDVIEKSDSPYNNPLWIVEKKPDSEGNKWWRIVLDFRALNDKMISDTYPLPNITEIFDQVGSASPGIYFEKEDNIRYYSASWDIVVFMDTTKLHECMPDIINALSKVRLTCKDEEMCSKNLHRVDFLNDRLSKLMDHFNQTLESLKYVEPLPPVDELRNIRKRAVPLGFIGSVSKYLFGTLSEEDGERYDSNIKELTQKQVDLAKIARDDAHLVHNQLNNLEKRMDVEREDIQRALIRLNETAKDIYYLNSQWYRWSYTADMNMVLNEVEAMINLYDDTLNNIYSIIAYARVSLLHPELITPAQLHKAIRQIEDHNGEIEFPLPIDKARIEKLINIADISLGYKTKKIVIKVRIP